MKRIASNCLIAGCAALVVSGCGTPGSNQEAASTAGAAVGAGVGLVAGAAMHRPMEGLAAGALIGGGSGAVVGQSQDRKEAANAATQRTQAEQARVAANPPVGKADVIMMTQAKVSDDVIVNKINSASYILPLAAQDLVDLKNAGVSDKVTNAMLVRLQTQGTAMQTAPPPPASTETHVYYYGDPWPWPYVYYAPFYYPFYHGYGGRGGHGGWRH